MSAIASYINQKNIARTVDIIIDETTRQYKERSNILDKVAPVKTYETFDFLALIAEEINPAARVVAPGQEIPLSQSGKLRELQAELLKIAVQHKYSEELQRRMIQALQYAMNNNATIEHIYDGGNIIKKGENNDLAQILFQNYIKMARACNDKLDSFAYQGLFYGEIIYTKDPITGAVVKIDYKDPNMTANHFPAALTATGNADKKLNKWDDHENANGLGNLWDDSLVYRDTNGYMPDYIIMHLETYNNLLQQQSTKDAASMLGSGVTIGTVSPDILDKVLKARMLPPIKVVEGKYRDIEVTDIINGKPIQKEVQKDFVPKGYYAFAKEKAGQRAIGVTLESSNSTVGDGSFPKPKPGIFQRTWEEKVSPPTDMALTVMNALPVYMRAENLFARKVH